MASSEWSPNPAQRRALEHGGGPLRIIAGAGSGKTSTLIRRIGALVEQRLCRPDQILMLTFTTRAVADIRTKVAAALGPGGAQPRVETYHAYAWSLVREFADQVGLPPDPVLLTEGPLRLLLRQQIDRLGLDLLDLTRVDAAAGTLLDFVRWHRTEGAFRRSRTELLAALDEAADRPLIEQLLDAAHAYRLLLRERGAVDYDDLIALAVELLEAHPAVHQEVTGRHPFLLVDEYQDTDHLQGELIRLLAGAGGNVTIVGDPDQTIYSFRGAAMTNILEFDQVWPSLTDVAMLTNYRSVSAIVTAANAVIEGNQRRKAGALEADRPTGDRPELIQAPDWETEARWLAAQIQALHAQGRPYGEIAVLVRRNSHRLPLFAALSAAGIPAVTAGGLDLFADPEVRRLIGLLQALADPADDGALTLALSMPRYGLTDRDLTGLARLRRKGEPLLAAVERSQGQEPRLRLLVTEFWPLYERQFTHGCQETVREAIRRHAGGMGPAARASAEQLIPLADGLFARPQLFEGPEDATGLLLFIRYLEALRAVGESLEAPEITQGQDAVRLMTVHAAKGLEFPVLFLPRLTERDFAPKASPKWESIFPLVWHHDLAFRSDFEAMMSEEERRLFYVALTRAQERLFLSWAPVDPARAKPMGPSAFLAEVAAHCEARSITAEEYPATGAGPGFDPDGLLQDLISDRPAPLPAPEGALAPEGGAPPVHGVEGPVELPEVLSYSHLHTFQLCPYRFYLQFVLRLPGRPNPAADEGIRIHASIERLAAAAEPVSLEQFRAWAGTGPALHHAEPDLAERAAEAEPAAAGPVDPLQAFWQSEYAQTPPVASEQEFHLRLGGAVVRGFIDRLHPLPDGNVEVVDFKSYNRLQTESEVRAGLQLPLYILACRQALGYPRASQGALFFLKHGQVVKVSYSDQELEERAAQALRLVSLISAGNREATPGPVCGYCPYRESCPAAQQSPTVP